MLMNHLSEVYSERYSEYWRKCGSATFRLAPVVQWIELLRPKEKIEVRFLSGVPKKPT